MEPKIAIVTGASSGIGLETCIGLAKQEFHVVMAARSEARGEQARKKVWAAAPAAKVDLLLADFSSLAEVRTLAETVHARYERIDVLVNNAGMFDMKREVSKDGFEMTFAVNHLAPFLLTNLLLDRLKRSGTARIVTVASVAHRHGRIDFGDLQGDKHYSWMKAYGQSKLANILFTLELAERLKGTHVTANSLHPGLVATNIAGRSGMGALFMKLGRPFLISPAKGAETSLFLATSPEVEGTSGEYFARSAPADTTKAAKNKADAKRLWEISVEMVGLPA